MEFPSFTETLIAPSLFAADFGRLAEEARRVEAAGADWLHIDVMDSHFVPNFGFGPEVVSAMRKAVTLPLDVHLMITRPDRYFVRFAEAGAHSITVHLEAEHDVGTTLCAIREAGCRVGLSIKPNTPVSAIEPHLPNIDLLLVMTINPGFGGQELMPSTLSKIAEAVSLRNEGNWQFHIEVDGGIKEETAPLVRAQGANMLVAGTAIFRAEDPAAVIGELRTKSF